MSDSAKAAGARKKGKKQSGSTKTAVNTNTSGKNKKKNKTGAGHIQLQDRGRKSSYKQTAAAETVPEEAEKTLQTEEKVPEEIPAEAPAVITEAPVQSEPEESPAEKTPADEEVSIPEIPETEEPAEAETKEEETVSAAETKEEINETPVSVTSEEERPTQEETNLIFDNIESTAPPVDEKEKTRSISLSSLEAEEREPIPETAVTYTEHERIRNSLFRRLSAPVVCMEQASERRAASSLELLWGMFLKWGLIMAPFAAFIASLLNKDPFSYARMVFTDACWLWFRTVLYGIILEYLGSFLAKAILKGGRSFTLNGYLTVLQESSLFVTIAGVCGSCFLFVHPAPAAALLLGTAAVGAVFRMTAAYITSEADRYRCILTVFLLYLAAGLLGYFWVRFVCADLIRIFNVIFRV